MNFSKENTDKLFFNRLDDAIRLSNLRKKCIFLGFLNECQTYTAKKYLNSSGIKTYAFFGGHESALRTYLCIYNEGGQAPSNTQYPIKALEFKYRKADSLSHRDFLGAVMALGITRESIGDIIVLENHAIVFAEDKIAEYLLSQITKIGSVGVKVSVCYEKNLDFPQKYKDEVINVSSMRLDNITAALAGLSREKTAQIILSGLVSVNYMTDQNVSRILTDGDIVSIRKTGKFIITDNHTITKKGRIRLSVKSYK